jgi:hypothetical protein
MRRPIPYLHMPPSIRSRDVHSSCHGESSHRQGAYNLVKHGLNCPQPMLFFTQWLIKVLYMYVPQYMDMQDIAASNDLA